MSNPEYQKKDTCRSELLRVDKARAIALFLEGHEVAKIAARLGYARGTVGGWVREHRTKSIGGTKSWAI